MGCAIKMRGEVQPIMIDEDFSEAVNALNLSAATGKAFIMADTSDGYPIAIAMSNILSIQGLDD